LFTATWPDSIVLMPVKMRTLSRMKLVAAIVEIVGDGLVKLLRRFHAFMAGKMLPAFYT
jgi:hypothetical protein